MSLLHLNDPSSTLFRANNSIQHANVNSIISATVQALLENPDRKFIEVEQAFFQRWWSEQSASKQAQVKELVAAGQLEVRFVAA